jgi:hypothetical protein
VGFSEEIDSSALMGFNKSICYLVYFEPTKPESLWNHYDTAARVLNIQASASLPLPWPGIKTGRGKDYLTLWQCCFFFF